MTAGAAGAAGMVEMASVVSAQWFTTIGAVVVAVAAGGVATVVLVGRRRPRPGLAERPAPEDTNDADADTDADADADAQVEVETDAQVEVEVEVEIDAEVEIDLTDDVHGFFAPTRSPGTGRPTVAPTALSPQCPRCGRTAVEARADQATWACGWCGHDWSVHDGEPWPDVVLCLWMPRAATPAIEGDRT